MSQREFKILKTSFVLVDADDVTGEGRGVGVIKTIWGWRVMLWWHHIVIRFNDSDNK